MTTANNPVSSDPQAIPARIAVSKPRKCRTAPGIKTAVIQRRVNNQSKRKIAQDLGIGRNTVTRILEDSHVEQALESGIQASVGLIPQAIRVAEVRLAANSENMAIKVLENTIWPLQSKTSKQPDTALTLAIQNLMGNVTVNPQVTENKEQSASTGTIAVPDNSAIEAQVVENKGNIG